MKQMQRDLFFAIVEAFEYEINSFQDCKRKLVGCTLHCSKEQRQKYIAEAEQYQAWEDEAMEFNKQFIELFEPDIE